MDLDSKRPELSDRAASAEPSSTRPNPFDDGDISSRKRRRTSLSGSPTISVCAMDPIHESSSCAKPDPEPAMTDCPPAEEGNQQPVAPQTPERPTRQNPPVEPPSSMVTINLRNAPNGDSAASSPGSPSPSANSAIATDEVKASVEETELDTAPEPVQSLDTPQSSSSSSGSPPIEVVTVQSDDDMIPEQQGAGVSIVGEDGAAVDPIRTFPFSGDDENPIDTIRRLVQYFSTQTSIEDHVLDNIHQWLEQYLHYVGSTDLQSALDSCRLNVPFWQAFQEIITTLDRRKSQLVKTLRRPVVVSLYVAFAKLTAWLVTYDDHMVTEALSIPENAGRRCPELLSPWYLGPLHLLIHPRLASEHSQDVNLTMLQSEMAPVLVGTFQRIEVRPQEQAGGSKPIERLATNLITLVPKFPRLIDALAPIFQLISDAMDAPFPENPTLANTGANGQESSETRPKDRLEVGHQLHNDLIEALTTAIEKHPTMLSSESLAVLLPASSDILRMCLRGQHEGAAEEMLLHRTSFPDVPVSFTMEALIYESRFALLTKAIQSGQMQLRVMGVTTMCTDLVGCWKRYSDGDESGTAFLNHLAQTLRQTGLIEYILGPNCHPEITVEGANIIGFLVVTKMYRQEHTDLLWQGITSSQNPRIADALTRMMAGIVNLFDYNGLLVICEKLQKLPIEGFTPPIRTLWDAIMRGLVSRVPLDRPELSFHPFDLCLRLLRDASICGAGSQVAHPDMQVIAMQKFKELLNHGLNADGRKLLYKSCIDDISEKSNTTLGSLWCLAIAIRPVAKREVHLLIEQHDLTRLIVEELGHAIDAGRSAGVPAVLAGESNHPRREFIHQIISWEAPTLEGKIGAKLWAMLVGPQSTCLDDREAGWTILNNIKPREVDNLFLQRCLSEYLPGLPSTCFCPGTLGFVRHGILPRVNPVGDLVLDNPEMVAKSGIEELWRLVLEADNTQVFEHAISTLVIDIYINSALISTFPLSRTRLIHLALVNRCLQQLKGAARKIKMSSDGTSSSDDEAMVIVATEEQVREQERIFTRTLKLLRLFLEAHQSKPTFTAPDLRTLTSETPSGVEGESAELKFQSFDGNTHTDVKPLSIGKLNTAASLLASLRDETGFDNYSVYYRGRPFLPSEHDICKSLEDLHVHDGLILVKREDDAPLPASPVKAGLSSLEVEISAHFNEMWEYLSMEEKLAEEIYHFLIKLPTDNHILKSIKVETASYRDVFPPGQPYKSLYAVHALLQYPDATLHGRITAEDEQSDDETFSAQQLSHTRALETSMSLIVQALSDEDVLDGASPGLRLTLARDLIQALLQLLTKLDPPRESLRAGGVQLPGPDRFVELLSNSATHPGNAPIPLITGTLHTMIRLSFLDAEFCDDLVHNESFPLVLRSLLLVDDRIAVRENAARVIEEGYTSGVVFMAEYPTRPGKPSLAQHFWDVIMALVPLTATSPYQCDQVFILSHALLVMMRERSAELLDTLQLASKASILLLDHSSTEVVGQIGMHDAFARGLTSLLHLCMQLDHSIASSPELPADFAHDLFWTHLYPNKRSETEQPVPRVILHNETRMKMVEIITARVKDDEQQMGRLITSLETLTPYFLEDADDPYLYELPSQFDRNKAIRASCGYVGLQNLSNTCYLNSLLTQLFMNTNFRRFMMNSKVREHGGGQQQLLFYTQKLFGYMQDSFRRFVDPSSVVNSIRTYDDTPIDIHNQMDVDEFYNLLFDRWEGQLINSVERKKLRSFYGGQLVQQVKSKECEHISERLEPFSAIQCDIKGKSSLEESLQAYVDGELMEGDNKYKCSTCDAHVDAVKRACLKDIPDNMIFHLKRFDFNLRTLQRSKINDHFSFPSRVNLRPYTSEHLSSPDTEDEEDMFELVGVLVHAGTAESGHYYSYIRERPSLGERQSWVEFNDDTVTPWDPANMETATFGGSERMYDNGAQFDKTYSAYMLFYQRASSLRAEQETMSRLKMDVPLGVEIAGSLKEHILDENTVILRRHCLFDPSHTKLVHHLFGQCNNLFQPPTGNEGIRQGSDENALEPPDDHRVKDHAMRVLVSNFDQVVTRAKDMPDFTAFSALIHESVSRCPWCAVAFFRYFDRRRESLRALLLRNPDAQVREFMSKVFVWVLQRIALTLPHLYRPGDQSDSDMDDDADKASHDQVSQGLPLMKVAVQIFNHLWRYFHIHIKAWDEFFAAILGFASMGSREAASVLGGEYLVKILKIIAADPSMNLPPNYARMLQTIMRRASNRGPPSYTALIALTNFLLHLLHPELGPENITEDAEDRGENKRPPFNWTSTEVELIHSGFDSETSSLFVEKLLSIDQAPENTDRIIEFLVRLSPEMDQRILGTLKRCIRGDSSTQMMDPFLRAARVYLENTKTIDSATKISHHVFLQAKSLQNTEGPYFVQFFRSALHLERPEAAFNAAVRGYALSLVPRWAPWLLSARDVATQSATRDFLNSEVFEACQDSDLSAFAGAADDDTLTQQDGDERKGELTPIMKQVGISCLLYLQDNHVRRRVSLRRSIANLFNGVLSQCTTVMDSDRETQDNLDVEYLLLRQEVIEPLRRIVVDDVEDDGSEWEGSCGSSDRIDDVVEMSMQAINEINDMDMS